jgi:2-keto-4-pentenoate hydratase
LFLGWQYAHHVIAALVGERSDAVLRTLWPGITDWGERDMDQTAIDEVARTFLRARQTGERLGALPAHLKPKDFAESCAVMEAVDRLVGDRILGTKIAAKPNTEVVYAPLQESRVFHSPARVPRALAPSQTMECEISFRLTRDLPARSTPYSEQEVFDALEACAAFELVDSRFRDLKLAMDTAPYEFYADHMGNGAMVFGAFRKDWQTFDFGTMHVAMKQGARTVFERVGGHPTVNPGQPALVLANIRRSTTGLNAGAFIVTGSFTGYHPVELNRPVIGAFEGFGTMEATIVG